MFMLTFNLPYYVETASAGDVLGIILKFEVALIVYTNIGFRFKVLS